MNITEYRELDGLALGELARNKEVAPAELLEAAIRQADEHNDALNAIVYRFDDMAMSIARDHDRQGSLAGVPMLLKDLGAEMKGVPTRFGCAFVPDTPGTYTSFLVERFQKAGLVPFAKTNTPELGLLPTTEPRLYGACHNPWNTNHITGGSSGGSSAAVAAGIVPVAHANDGGGSIRIPASCCGLVGMKPTRGRNPLGPAMGDQMNGLVHDHVVTRTVRDSAAVLDATHGNVQGDPYWAPPAPESFLSQVSIDPGRLKIGLTDVPPFGGQPDAEVAAGLQRTADTLVGLGHDIEQISWPVGADFVNEIFMTIWMAGCASGIHNFARITGRQPDEALFEPLTWSFYQLGKLIDASTYLLAVGGMQSVAREIAAAHAEYDVVLTPTLGKAPLELGEIDTTQTDIEAQSEKLLGFAAYTPLQNMTGQPSINLPLHMSNDGLPIGMMFTGRFGDEATLYRLAGQLEREMPWRDRRPKGFF